MSHVRDHHPVAAQVGTRDFLDAAQFNFFDLTKLAEVHFRPRQHAWQATTGSGRSGFGAFDRVFHVSLNVFAQDTAFTASALHFRQVNTELTRQAADDWGSVNVGVVFSELAFTSGRCSRFGFLLGRSRCSFCFLGRSSGRCWCSAFHFEHHDQGTGFHFVAGSDFNFFHGARERSRNFHRSLVTFNGDQ
ncbi:hypothetical protein D3C79_878810 [compost metagenome]